MMKLLYVCNAFSLSMIDREYQATGPLKVVPWPISLDAAREMAQQAAESGALVSAIGHADTARIISAQLGIELGVNRISVKLVRESRPGYWGRDDHALIAQYVGPRLPEGATQLPEGATIEWWLV